MNIVIVGAGATGVLLAQHLMADQKHRITLIEIVEEKAEHVARDLDALVLHGDGTHPDILEKAQIHKADALVAVTGSDAINTVIAMLGKLFEVEKRVVRLKDTALRAACEHIGVTDIIAPRLASVSAIKKALYGLRRLDLALLDRSGLRVVQLSGTTLEGKRVSDIALPDGALLIAIARNEDELVLPRAGATIEKTDELLIVTESDVATDKVRAVLNLDTTQIEQIGNTE